MTKDPRPISQTGGGDYVPLLSAAQVAHWLGLNPGWIYRLAKNGDLPSVRFGKRVLFDRRAIATIVENGGISPSKDKR